ncbi:LysE/ArgO family amino acid transporter [Neisseria perflava]|uniref:LysE/ArgO family amino acid transporter n=1 Tax=Neisseria perflava TaxID=33053 RepID=UPI00209FE68B|nr:LysE family transporter [Neisseria perflava]MCP1660903.1 L-lysine exporter family protein LysE/ArgO [Neisseria perflava]MCP1773179.1 L-lysine exporter family protein LysE/ArgO [Neisseria perflava]
MITGSLIIAIGAQNAFVLKSGLLKQHSGLVAMLCWLCDIALIGLGVFGITALIADNGSAAMLLSLLGGLFLLAYGLLSARRAWHGGNQLSVDGGNTPAVSRWKTAATTLALTLLNPHVYIDAVMLIGGSAAALRPSEKGLFFLGAITASGLWFLRHCLRRTPAAAAVSP